MDSILALSISQKKLFCLPNVFDTGVAGHLQVFVFDSYMYTISRDISMLVSTICITLSKIYGIDIIIS